MSGLGLQISLSAARISMATTADDPIFIDTNVLIYADLISSPFHALARKRLVDLHAGSVDQPTRSTAPERSSADVKGKQVHDANIVATMLGHGLDHILTHNTADFERFRGLIDVVPLAP